MVRPGGLLVIDHRNYDHILSTGCAPAGKNIYYKVGSGAGILGPWALALQKLTQPTTATRAN